MHLLTVAPRLTSFLVALVDDVPKDKDVKAGWVAFAIFIGLIVAVAFLGWSLVRHLRKAQAAEDAGMYDHDPAKRPTDQPTDRPTDRPSDRPSDDNERGDKPADHQS